VQSRVRSGATPEVVSAETGWPLDKVQRYADPPLAERSYIAERAQAVTLRGSGDAQALGEVAGQALAALGLGSLDWDAFRRESDGRWVVTAAVPGTEHQAVWSYDATGRTVHPQNAFARVLMGLEDAPEPPAEEERPHLVAVPPKVVEEPADPRADTLTLDMPRTTTDEPVRRKSRSRRASVPSWDEILFGTQRDRDQ